MSSAFIDLGHSSHDITVPKPRGMLPVPTAVAEFVSQEQARIQAQHGVKLTEEARQRVLNDQTLDWFYHDHWVSYRESEEGVEVLAVGLDEIERLEGNLSEEEWKAVRTRQI